MDTLNRRMNSLIKACLVLALLLVSGLSLRSAIIASERARVLENQLVDLQITHEKMRVNIIACYDELSWHKRKGLEPAIRHPRTR